MAIVEIPISNTDPAFSFTAVLDGETFNFEFRWNTRREIWVFDLKDSLGVNIQTGNPFLTGFIFLRQNVSPSAPKGDLIAINTSKDFFADADRFSIGNIVKLMYVEEGTEVEEEVDADEGAT